MPSVGKKESGLEAAEDGGMIPGIAVNWLSCETIVHQLRSQNKASGSSLFSDSGEKNK